PVFDIDQRKAGPGAATCSRSCLFHCWYLLRPRCCGDNRMEGCAMKRLNSFLIASSLTVLVSVPAFAQQIKGVPGSPSATTTIPGDQLPAPPPEFGGKIEREATKSTPYWPARIVPPEGAPNAL